MQNQESIKRYLITWDSGRTTIIEGTTEEDAHTRAGFNHYSWSEMRSCVEIKDGKQVEETAPLGCFFSNKTKGELEFYIDQALLNPDDLDEQSPVSVWKLYAKTHDGTVYEYVHESWQFQNNAQLCMNEIRNTFMTIESLDTLYWSKIQ